MIARPSPHAFKRGDDGHCAMCGRTKAAHKLPQFPRCISCGAPSPGHYVACPHRKSAA